MQSDSHAERGISTRVVEIAVAVAIFALGALVVFDSVRLGAQWGSDGPQAGYFPFYIGSFICICATVVLLGAIIRRPAEPSLFVSWIALRRVLQVLGPATVYVLGIQLFGLYLASATYIAFFMMWLGRYGWFPAGAIGIGVMAFFFLMFEVWFKVPLYKGLLDPLGFLGY